jgi:NTE family protein
MDIALALGGGGSRGYAHIGVIRHLEQEGFRIKAIAGTSAGGIISALYAAEYTPSWMEKTFASIDQASLFGRSSKDGPSLLGLSGAEKLLKKYLGNLQFSDLHIPCGMTAVDVTSAREVMFKEGSVVEAVLATIAVPAVFPPKQINGMVLVDGATLDPVPVSVARLLAPRLPVVAVALSPKMGTPGNPMTLSLPIPLLSPLVERLSRLRLAQALKILVEAQDASGRMLTDLRLEIDEPDVVIRPDVSDVGLLDVVDVHKLVRRGERAVEAVLPELRKMVSIQNRIRRGLSANRKNPGG